MRSETTDIACPSERSERREVAEAAQLRKLESDSNQLEQLVAETHQDIEAR